MAYGVGHEDVQMKKVIKFYYILLVLRLPCCGMLTRENIKNIK